ncbi:MAG: prepilin peptidase [Alphaproteobacteria bacterium]|nr:prepilin peptidase [Alphaproteobacteria bacterium]
MLWLAAHQFTVMGILWMLVLGPAVGNYACSVVYRLPRGKTPFERHPYCGHCNADLKPVDLFPIGSWLSTRGKCRYCAGVIPGIYTLIELACGAVFVSYFLHFGMSEAFLLYAAYAVFVVILAAIHWQQGWIAATIYSYAFACLALARALAEQTIYPTIQGAFLLLLGALLLFRFFGNRAGSPFEKPWIWWCVLLGALVPLVQWPLLVPVFLLALLVPKEARVIVYAAAALALPLFV